MNETIVIWVLFGFICLVSLFSGALFRREYVLYRAGKSNTSTMLFGKVLIFTFAPFYLIDFYVKEFSVFYWFILVGVLAFKILVGIAFWKYLILLPLGLFIFSFFCLYSFFEKIHRGKNPVIK